MIQVRMKQVCACPSLLALNERLVVAALGPLDPPRDWEDIEEIVQDEIAQDAGGKDLP